jgi:type IV pilus assembly protein PilA
MRSFLVACSLLVAVPAWAGSPAAQPSLLDQVPDAALLGGALRASALDIVHQYFRQTPEMQKDVGTFLNRRIGVDLTRVEGAAFWSTQLTPQTTMGLFLKLSGAPTALKGQKVGSFDNTDLIGFSGKLVAAAVPGGIILGDDQEVRVGVAVAHKHAPALGANSPLAMLLKEAPGADLLAGLAASAVKDPQMQQTAAQYGVKTVSLVFRADGLIQLTAAGDGARLKNAQQTLTTVMNVVLAQARMKHDQAMADDRGDIAEDVGAIAGYHQLVAVWNEINPRLEGDKLVGRYQMPQLKTSSMLIPIIGIGAAVAIPAFLKYVRRSKTVEATTNVRRLADAAAALAAEQGPKKKGKFAFPKSTEWTPARGCCGQPGDKCGPDASAWKGATWTALGFSVEEPAYYQYRVTSKGAGARATVTVEARGDLDCDGKFSSFKRVVTVDAQGNPTVSPLDTSDEIE